MKRWRGPGAVDTIYEEEHECFSTTASSSDISSPLSPLRSAIEACKAAEKEPDVLIHVRGTCFQLHKDPMSRRSGYLRRHLTDAVEITISPPLNITPETFSLVADFCYRNHVCITPFNVVLLRVAAELLEMTGEYGANNLQQITETYFRRYLTVSPEYARALLRCSLTLLPEAETTASLVGRCLEALNLKGEVHGLPGDVVVLRAEEFLVVAEAVRRRFSSHDLLYQIIDAYFQEHGAEMTEENKLRLCNLIDCVKLSENFLLHAVQNPRMPLRFLVRSILAEQINARHRVLSEAGNTSETLGSILCRESAARQAAEIRAAMNDTSLRMESLEKQLGDMKKLLATEGSPKPKESHPAGPWLVKDSARSASFHCFVPSGKVERGERGAASSLSLRLGREAVASSSSGGSSAESPKIIKSVTRRLIRGLKSTLAISKQDPKKAAASRKVDGDRAGDDSDVYDDLILLD